MLARESGDLVFAEACAGTHDNNRVDGLAPFLVRDAEDGDIVDVGVLLPTPLRFPPDRYSRRPR